MKLPDAPVAAPAGSGALRRCARRRSLGPHGENRNERVKLEHQGGAVKPPDAGWRGLRCAAALGALLAALVGGGDPWAAGADAEPGVLRVGTSGDYPPFSAATGSEPAQVEGFDLDVARAFAADLGLELRIVRFRWPELLSALSADRFDVAMGGITVRPERSAVGRFTAPVAETGAVLLVPPDRGWKRVDDLDRGGVQIGVNAGGHLERVARARFPEATLLAVPDNSAILPALRERRVDAAVTDTVEARLWKGRDEDLRVLGPFTRDRKAYLVQAERGDLAARLDAWLLERERDGTLAALREAHLAEPSSARTALALAALLAAMDERLALMPLVGAAKRRAGLPLVVPSREEAVIEAARAQVRAEAARRAVDPPADAAVRRLFRAQIEAAKEVQRRATARGAIDEDAAVPDLDGALRPGILRIGERITRLLFELPRELDARRIADAAREELRSPWLGETRRREIAAAIAALWAGDAPSEEARGER